MKLKQQVAQAEEWVKKAESNMTAKVAIRELDKVLKQGRSLPLNFESVFQQLEARYKRALKL